MKTLRFIVPVFIVITISLLVTGFAGKSECSREEIQNQRINMFVTHGHCSLPFSGKVDNLQIDLVERNDQGNPLENMTISFEIDPNSFNACSGGDNTSSIKTPGLFMDDQHKEMRFRSTNVYTMGIDWYQINGVLSIKGVEQDVKFFATGIREPDDTKTKVVTLEGQANLL